MKVVGAIPAKDSSRTPAPSAEPNALGLTAGEEDQTMATSLTPHPRHLPHNDMQPLEPGDAHAGEEVHAAADKARAALKRLAGMPETPVERAALEDAAALAEADASSAIEGIEAGIHRMALSREPRPGDGSGKDEDTDAALALSCLDAHASLLRKAPAGSAWTRACSKVCGTLGRRRMPVRTGGVVIAGSGGVVYTPPVGRDRLERMLADLWRFVDETAAGDPLVRMAAAHYQFESIHPFEDGNGRVGRMVNAALLAAGGVKGCQLLPLSRGIAEARGRYYQLLGETRERTGPGRLTPWVLYMLDRVQATAVWTADTFERLRRTAADTEAQLPAAYGTTMPAQLVRMAGLRPATRPADVTGAGLTTSEATAEAMLERLADDLMLESEGEAGARRFLNPQVIASWARTGAPLHAGW